VRLLGVDVGGTFTDIILADTENKRFSIHKTSTTSPDPSEGVVSGITELCNRQGITIGQIDHLFHGTTVATNAILEYKGARTGMITTKGYRDIIHIGRHQRPQNYSIVQDIPWQLRPLVQRRHRKVVAERLIPPSGDVLVPLDEREVRDQIRTLKSEGVESIAVCFLFSYLNSKHEDRVCELIRKEYPGAFVTSSSDVSPQFREFERFTTACLNAFLGPKVKFFIDRLSRRLRQAGARTEMHIMTSNGGVATARTIAARPVYTLLSGPAAGVLGGEWVSRPTGRKNLITFDVGGTSADIGIVTPRGMVEASARDTTIAGYPVMVPMIDIHSIGAGGGSIAYVDAGGAFRVGPRSAGSMPGPACYGRGGEEPTVTDANIVLGRLDRNHFLGGSMSIHPEFAFAAIERLAHSLNMDVYEAAEGVNTILASNMANAIRSRTVQKGHDPRKFALVAFGGAGPLHAVDVARHLKIPEVIVPTYPGLTSALGLLTTDLKYDFLKTEFMVSPEVNLEKLRNDVQRLFLDATARLKADGVTGELIRLSTSLDLRYAGQGYELRIPVPDGPINDGVLETIWTDFHERHRSEYGHAFPNNAIEIVNLRVSATGMMPTIALSRINGQARSLEAARIQTGETYFRVNGNLQKVESTFYERSLIPSGPTVCGPAVIFQHDSTTVLPPGSSAIVDEYGNILIDTMREL